MTVETTQTVMEFFPGGISGLGCCEMDLLEFLLEMRRRIFFRELVGSFFEGIFEL